MGAVYAAVGDIKAIGRELTAQQEQAAGVLLEQASAKLRLLGHDYGRDIDAAIADPVTGEDYALAVKSVVVQAVCRALDAVDTGGAYSSASESLGPYTYNYSYLNAGQQIYFLTAEKKELGFLNQRMGWLDVYGVCE